MGGKVLVPTQEAIQKLVAARLAADVMGVPTLVIARTDADAADLITSDCDPYDREFYYRGSHQRRVLPHPRRDRAGDQSRAGLCAVRGSGVVRNVETGS